MRRAALGLGRLGGLACCGVLAGFLMLATPAAAQIRRAGAAPDVEVSLTYSYVRVRAFVANLHGGSGSVALNLRPWLGLVADVGAYHGSDPDVTEVTYLFGPRVSYRGGRWTPFAQALFGGAHVSFRDPRIGRFTRNGFAFSAGGGFDYQVSDSIALRVFQGEYLYTQLNPGQDRHAGRFSAGIVFRFSGR